MPPPQRFTPSPDAGFAKAHTSGKDRGEGTTKKRDLPKVLDREQVERLLAVPNLSTPTGVRNRLLMELMYRAGLRVSEACGLELRDVREGGTRLHIRGELAKGGREAFVPIDDRLKGWIERWRDGFRRQGYVRPHPATGETEHVNFSRGKPWLLLTLKGGQLTRGGAYRVVETCARRAGLGPVHPHMLRHTFATELLRDGFDLRQVQELMRHSNITTTSVYLHVFNPELDKRVRERR